MLFAQAAFVVISELMWTVIAAAWSGSWMSGRGSRFSR
jgi:hypothetical protein